MIPFLKRILCNRRALAAMGFLIVLLGYLFYAALPEQLFRDPYSTVLEDRNGQLLGARIAADGQWRFPHRDEVPDKFQQAIIQFEDKRFHQHPGVDPIALVRAISQNLSAGEVRSGASTLSMQVVRLWRKGQPRTYKEKLIEAILALRLELSRSKDEILALYSSHAPFGGNVVGLEAASWRYFGRGAQQLSWAETATLAVLPNAPALVHPGRNRDLLRAKRDRLLNSLHEHGLMDETSLQLALLEPLPGKPLALPSLAPHLLDRLPRGTRKHSSLSVALQERVQHITDRYAHKLADNGVHNGALLVVDNQTSEILAYIGNTGDYHSQDHGAAVDITRASRSTGSLLKPFLYGAMLDEGSLLPQSLQADIPTHYGHYAPKNFNRTYQGAVAADLALARSLNVPAVRQLNTYGVDRFQYLLQRMGMTTLTQAPDHYGLALILGGAEGSLWEMASLYSGMARTLLHHQQSDGRYFDHSFQSLKLERGTEAALGEGQTQAPHLGAAAIWHTLQALTLVNRPESSGAWKLFGSSRKIAWKTGTSFGFRDAWSIGVTPEYTVAVWVGNADGVGRPGLVGTQVAAPIMFEVFRYLEPEAQWFTKPVEEMIDVVVCARSGFAANPDCPQKRPMTVPMAGQFARACPYHELVHLDASESYRVHGDCESPAIMVTKPWFVLPAGMAWFAVKSGQGYEPLPSWRQDCETNPTVQTKTPMEWVYPRGDTRIFLPKDLDGSLEEAVFEIVHRDREGEVHWHLDGDYLGSTNSGHHQMALRPKAGSHRLVVVDQDGFSLELEVELLARND